MSETITTKINKQARWMNGNEVVPVELAHQISRDLIQAQQTIAQQGEQIRSLKQWMNQIYNIAASVDGGPVIMEGRRCMIIDIAKRAESTPAPVAVVPKLTGCDCCHDEFATDQLELTGTQFLCAKCKKGNQ